MSGRICPSDSEVWQRVLHLDNRLNRLHEYIQQSATSHRDISLRLITPPIHKNWSKTSMQQAMMEPVRTVIAMQGDGSAMDYISAFDIRLAKDVYYAGESVGGTVLLENTENIKIKGIRVLLRGKVHATLKVVKSGERRTIKDDQYIIDEKVLVWGKDKNEECESLPILARGLHQLPFSFALPQSTLPCSLESRHGTIRYYIKVIIDIPYSSSPQGIKYFTIIGPHIDCMEEKYLAPLTGQDRKVTCCWCCQRGALALRVTLERTAYVCGENVRVRAQVENRQNSPQVIKIQLIQHVEYFIEKGVLGETKSISCIVFEHKSAAIAANSQGKYDSTLEQPIRLPVVPPTLVGVCRLIQIYYVLRACLEDEKANECLHLDFPLTVATVPYRIPNAPAPPIEYEFCSHHVEGGKYVSPEFRLGQVYDGDAEEINKEEEVVLYRPVYAKLSERRIGSPQYKDKRSGSFTKIHDSTQSIITESNGGRRMSITLQSPLHQEQSLSRQNLRAESEDDPLINKKT